MSKIGLDRNVLHEGEITSIRKLTELGLIEYKHSPDFWGGRTMREAWFVNIKGTGSGWEITKSAYEAGLNLKEVKK